MFTIVNSDGQKFLYDPIISDLAKVIGAKNIIPCFEETRDATPEEIEILSNALRKDSNPTFWPIEEE